MGDVKTCTTCRVEKPPSEFHKRKGSPDGLQYTCKTCSKARDQARYERDREAILVRQREQRERHPESFALRNRRWMLRRNYGLTVDEYEAMLAEQGGKCPVCGADLTEPAKIGKHPVDHCHETGAVRRILCSKCNTGMGMFNDNPELLRAAAAYLEQFRTS